MLVLGDLVIRVHERGWVTRDANIRNGDDSGIWVSQNLVIFRFRISKIPKFQNSKHSSFTLTDQTVFVLSVSVGC
ncbi:MAG: hypothetical protein CBE00_11110 [Planctomycetaceae bacterium TMED240]|nr:hypothetical protein [Rhodopirellula sp.]OUX05197.1 MAG: hypothetical protein CBE00_11110 [Planctomycetaceae bacterium TMED240]